MKNNIFLSILFLGLIPSFTGAASIALPQGDQLFVGQVENRQNQLEK